MIADLARRGLSHPDAVAFVKRACGKAARTGGGHEDVDVPIWGVVLLYVSFMVAVVGVSMLSYMLNEVITTLCMVESPVAAITVTTETADKEEKEVLLETGPTVTLVNQRPITSSIRGTIRHLVAHAGRFARFRAFRIHALHSISFSIVSTFFSAALPQIPGQPIVVAAISGAAVANIHAAWTHKVVSLPSDKSFAQRLPSKANWKVLAVPAAISAAMPYVSLYLIGGVAMLMGLHKLDQENFSTYTGVQALCLLVRLFATVVLAITCTLFLCLPAIVTLVRIEASILPEDEDTIVPFDRSFGGKASAAGKVGFLDAWRSFNWEARRRLIKLFTKVFFILGGAVFIIVHVLVAEAFLVMGPMMGDILSHAKADGWAQ